MQPTSHPSVPQDGSPAVTSLPMQHDRQHPHSQMAPDAGSVSHYSGIFTGAQNTTALGCNFFEIHGDQITYHNAPQSQTSAPLASGEERSYTRCPPATHLFTGRSDILNDLEVYFFSNVGARHVSVLHGLGGAGKTQIAYRFVEMCAEKDRFSEVFFVDASTINTINAQLENIALAKGIGKSADSTLRWLTSRRQEWLILFNNADDVKLDLFKYFPSCSYGNILITTRNPELRLHAPDASFAITEMAEEDAIDFLLFMVARKDSVTKPIRDQVSAIVKELGHLPLAIAQAGAYIAKNQNLTGYLELYRKNRVQFWQAAPIQTHDMYNHTVYTTWRTSFDCLQPDATTFLRICSFMHHDGISEDIFRAAFAAVPSYDAVAVPVVVDFLHNFSSPRGEWDSYLFQKAMDDVLSYSLVSYDHTNNIFSVHPLVHSWICAMIEEEATAQASTAYDVYWCHMSMPY